MDNDNQLFLDKSEEFQASSRSEEAFGLHRAIEDNDLDNIFLLAIDPGQDLNAKNTYGLSPLMIAARHGFIDALKTLVSAGSGRIEIDDKDAQGRTALAWAAQSEKQETFNELLAVGASPAISDNCGETVAMTASRMGAANILNALIERVADPEARSKLLEAKNEKGLTAVMLAVEESHVGVLSILKEAGAHMGSTEVEKIALLHLALKQDNPEVIRIILGDHPVNGLEPVSSIEDVAIDLKRSLIPTALEFGKWNFLKAISERGTDLEEEVMRHFSGKLTPPENILKSEYLREIDLDSDTREKRASSAVMLCVEHHALPALEILIKLRKNVDERNYHFEVPLMRAAQLNDIRAAGLLIGSGANLDAKNALGDSSFAYAARHGHVEMFDYLMKTDPRPADHPKRAKDGYRIWEGIKSAIVYDQLEFLKHILNGYVNEAKVEKVELLGIDLPCPVGYTIATLAAVFNKPDAMKIIIDSGANLEAKSGSGKTALHSASESGHLQIVEMLIAAGADLNSGQPIEVAAEKGHMDVVRALFLAGADAEIDMWNGQTLLIWAAVARNVALVELLVRTTREHGPANIHARDKFHRNALMYATELGFSEIVGILSDASSEADLNSVALAVHAEFVPEQFADERVLALQDD